MPTLVQCPRCTKNWVPEDSEYVCVECEEPLKVDAAVVAVYQAVQTVDKLNFRTFTSQHKTALRSAYTQLEAILNGLERD